MTAVKKVLSCGAVVMALCCMLSSSAYALGQETEWNWHGVSSGASYGHYYPDGTYDWNYDDQYVMGIDQTVESSQLDGAAWAKTSAYSMHGYLDGSLAENGEVYNDTLDELFFTTTSGDSASIDFNFNFNFSTQVLDPTIATERYLSDASMDITLWADGITVDKRTFVFRSSESMTDEGQYDYFIDLYSTKKTVVQNPDGSFTYTTPDETFSMTNGAFDFSSPIILSTAGWAGASKTDGLVDSGTYLPIMISIQVSNSSGNLIVDYANSFDIDSANPYDAYDANGNKLASTAYTLASLENFDQPSTATVPEPTTLLLFGSGLVGAFIKKRKA